MDVDTFSSTRLTVMDEEVSLSIGVSIHQVTGIGSKSYIATISTDFGFVAETISGIPVGMDTNLFSSTRFTVVDEDIGMGSESYMATVRTDAGIVTSPLSLHAIRVNVDPLSSTRLTVMDEDIPLSIGVSIHQVTGIGSKSYIATISTERFYAN